MDVYDWAVGLTLVVVFFLTIRNYLRRQTKPVRIEEEEMEMAAPKKKIEPRFGDCKGLQVQFRLRDDEDQKSLPIDDNLTPAYLQDIRNEIVELKKIQAKQNKALTRLNTILTDIFGAPKEDK